VVLWNSKERLVTQFTKSKPYQECMAHVKRPYQERMRGHSKHSRSRQELIRATQEEWEKLDWDKVDKMIDSKNGYKKEGGHISH
jgi:hypothetical protein